MFGSLGVPEILFILVLALLIFGPRRLPEIGKTLGKAMGEFRRATTDLKSSIEREVILEQSPPPAQRAQAKTKKAAPVKSAEAASEATPPAVEEPQETVIETTSTKADKSAEPVPEAAPKADASPEVG